MQVISPRTTWFSMRDFQKLFHTRLGVALCKHPPPSPVQSERLPGVFHARPRSVQVDRPPNCNLPTTAGNNTA